MSVRILLVDDDQDFLAVIEEALGARGYTVLTAPGAVEALLRLEADDVDVVVTDVIMPAMSGLRLLELIVAAQSRPPVIIMSGFLTDQITKDALALGARAVLEKTVSADEMARVIARDIERRPPDLHG